MIIKHKKNRKIVKMTESKIVRGELDKIYEKAIKRFIESKPKRES